MHPSCALIVWCVAILGAQRVGYAGLLVLTVVPLLVTPSALPGWLRFIRRAKWLLLTLWVILAYNTPGEAWLDLPWAPTYEGLAEGALQSVRLLVVLAWLAWLFARLGQEHLIAGLWGLMQPFRFLGLRIERLVVRLSLVLTNLQAPQRPGEWRRMLHVEAGSMDGPDCLSVSAFPWSVRDTLTVFVCSAILLGVLLL